MELADDRRRPWSRSEFARRTPRREDRLDRRSGRSSKSPSTSNTVRLSAGLGDHLPLLDGRDPARRVADRDLGVRTIGEPAESAATPVSPEVATRTRKSPRRARPRLLERLREEQGHALQSHVLEGQSGPVPELEHETVVAERANRRDLGMIEVVAVGLAGDGHDLARGRSSSNRPKIFGCPLPVRHGGERPISARLNSGTRSGTKSPPPGAMPWRMTSVKGRVVSRDLVSRYLITASSLVRGSCRGQTSRSRCDAQDSR